MAITAIVFSAVTDSYTNDNQPPAGRTGANIGAVETTCGTSTCHNNTPNTGGGSISIAFSDPNFKYVNGQTYDMTVTTNETGKVVFGFEITVVDAEGDSVGTFIIPNGVTNESKPSGGVNHRRYLGHKNAGSTNSWSFQWKASATDRGDLTFFAAGNCANGNGNSSGDHIYTTSLSISHDFGVGIVSLSDPENDFQIQSISGGQLNVKFNVAQNMPVTIRLYDLNGRRTETLLDENSTAGEQMRTFHLKNSLPNGVYLLEYHSGREDVTKKFLYQN